MLSSSINLTHQLNDVQYDRRSGRKKARESKTENEKESKWEIGREKGKVKRVKGMQLMLTLVIESKTLIASGCYNHSEAYCCMQICRNIC